MAILIDILQAGAVDGSGDPLDSGVAYVYKVGTTTFANIYQDDALTQPASNPITLDSAGKAEVYANEEVRLVIEDSTGVTIDDIASLGDVDTATTTTVESLSAAYRRAISGRPRFFAATSGGTAVTIPAAGTKPKSVLIGTTVYTNTGDITVDFSTSGRNGLDTGAVAANTPYYLYAIPNTDGLTFDAVLSATNPDTGPTGWSSWSYLGALATDSGAATLGPFMSSRGIAFLDEESESETHTGNTTITSKTFATMPATVNHAYFLMEIDGTVVDSGARIMGASTSGANALFQKLQVSTVSNYTQGWCPIFTAQTVYLQVDNGSNTIVAFLLGWRENPMEWT